VADGSALRFCVNLKKEFSKKAEQAKGSICPSGFLIKNLVASCAASGLVLEFREKF